MSNDVLIPRAPPDRSLALLCHPASLCPAVESLSARVSMLPDGALLLAYRLAGRLGRLSLAAPQPGGFADGLWQHSCFELFIGVAGDAAYREFNFSPSGQWAAYAFSGYRQRADFDLPASAPVISMRREGDRLAMDVRLDRAFLPPVSPGSSLQLGPSAVIETTDGALSYWALAHPLQAPDFHQRDAFMLDFPVPVSESAR